MKRFLFLFTLSISLILFNCKSTPGGDEPLPKITHEYEKIDLLLPAKTDFLIQFKSIQSLYRNLLFNDFSLFGIELSDEQLKSMKKMVGFNILSLKELKENGFDTTIPIGLGFIDFGLGLHSPTIDYANTFALFIPATDPGKVLKWLFKVQNIDMEEVEQIKDKNIFFFQGKNKTYYVARATENYVIVAQKMNIPAGWPNDKESLAQLKQIYIDSVLPQTTLADSPNYKNVAAKLNIEKDAFLYINMQTLMEKLALSEKGNKSERVFFDLFKGLLGLGYTADYSGPDLVIDSVMNIEPDSIYSRIYSDVTIDNEVIFSLKEKPVFFAKAAFNIEAFYRQIITQFENSGLLKAGDISDKIRQLNKMLGIDIENDIIANFAGSANLVVTPSHTQEIVPPVAVVLNLKDQEKFSAVLTKLEPVLLSAIAGAKGKISKETIAGGEVTKITAGKFTLFIGTARNNFILATDRNIYEQLAGGSRATGFLSSLNDKEVVSHLTSDLSCFYLDFPGALELLKHIPTLSPLFDENNKPAKKVIDFFQQLNYLLAYNNFSGSSLTGTFKIKTAFKKSFMQSLVEFIFSLFPIDKYLVPPNIT